MVGAISPWNFPLVLAVRKIAPALAAGCPVVLKPASATPLCAIELAKSVETAGLPAGVFQLVLGKAGEIAAEMLENPVCRKITFTGSTEVGRELIRGAASTITKLSLELGGHAPVLVFDDADLDIAVQGALITKFRNSGQSCIAANRIYVQAGIYDRFLQRFIDAVAKMKVGNGLDEGVEVGPLLNQQGLNTAAPALKMPCNAAKTRFAAEKRPRRSGIFSATHRPGGCARSRDVHEGRKHSSPWRPNLPLYHRARGGRQSQRRANTVWPLMFSPHN